MYTILLNNVKDLNPHLAKIEIKIKNRWMACRYNEK